VIPSVSVGFSAHIGLDLFILNEGMVKVGYFKSTALSVGVSNDGLTPLGDPEGQLILPCEIYHSAEKKLTFLILRGGASKFWQFGEELGKFIKDNGFL
jgi:hypothetical protein